MDVQSTRQQELLYNAEFQIQQMERKVARGLGERSDEEKKVLMDQIDKCNGELSEVGVRERETGWLAWVGAEVSTLEGRHAIWSGGTR